MSRPRAKNPATQYHSRAESFLGADKLAESLGYSLAPMLKRYGLPKDVLADPEASISYNAMCATLETCGLEWNCPDFGLRLAEVQNLNIFGPIGLVARLTDTVGDALQALGNRMSVHSTGFAAFLDEGDVNKGVPASITFTPKPDSGAGRQNVELSLGVCRNILAAVTGLPNFKPLRVCFRHEPPADTGPARRYFGCPVYYGETENVLYFDAHYITRPTAIRDTAYAPLIRAYFEQIKPRAEVDIVETTTHLIGRLLSTKRCSREAVAECLSLHPRTLQRRLKEKGVSFADLMDDYRKNLALDLVRRGSVSLVRIADALGYADQSSFNQAFKRWTETAPLAFRKQTASASTGLSQRPG